jgi:probable addiction module antidote protein
MTKRINVAELPNFDVVPYLDTPQVIAAYLTNILAAADASLLVAALGDVIRARGITDVAKSAGITRDALYQAMWLGSAPRFDTISRICAALSAAPMFEPPPE